MYTKNELKNLIYIQENKPCNEQTIKGLFRSIVEPILEKNVECIVLCRLENKSKKDFNGILKRLEFTNAKVYDFSDNPISDKFQNILKEKIWNKTEFLYVLAERFGAVLIFDYEESEMENFAQIYTMHNSKNLSESLEIINSNSTVDLMRYEEQWRPDRRDNAILNSSIRKIIENLNETNQEMLISQLEKETSISNEDSTSKLNFLLAKANFLSHEMRNLFSICNLYSTIIEKQNSKVQFADIDTKKSILNARACIKKALMMAGNLLLDFKSMRSMDLKEYNLKILVNLAIVLSKVYSNGKNVKFTNKVSEPVKVLVDECKFLSVLINLIKNAIESMSEETNKIGLINFDANVTADEVQLTVSNNGFPISQEVQDKIFEEGFTTKSSGTGLGLVICKQTLEEQNAQLKLLKSDDISTEFEITIPRSK